MTEKYLFGDTDLEAQRLCPSELFADIDPDTLQVGVHLMKDDTLPVQLSNITARHTIPPWPHMPVTIPAHPK